MRVSLIALHFAEYAARLALALAPLAKVQLHLSSGNAADELSPALRTKLEQSVELVLHSRITRANSPLRGWVLARAIRRFSPDVIHAQEAGDWAVAMTRLVTPDIRWIYTVHDPQPHSGRDEEVAHRNRWPRRLLRRSAVAIIVHGNSIVPAMAAGLWDGSRRVRVIPHGTLGDCLPPPTHLGQGFLFFGRIEAYKGLDVLLAAAKHLAETNAPVDVHVAGRGSDLDALRPLLATLPGATLDEDFVPADSVAALMRGARAVVLPYRNATQSGVVANAFAAGVPVIASGVGALGDVLKDGINALVVSPGDATALAAAMTRLAADDSLARQLAEGAAATARSKLSWESIAQATMAVYAEKT